MSDFTRDVICHLKQFKLRQFIIYSPSVAYVIIDIINEWLYMYFCGSSFCFMSWCLKFFVLLAPYVFFFFFIFLVKFR